MTNYWEDALTLSYFLAISPMNSAALSTTAESNFSPFSLVALDGSPTDPVHVNLFIGGVAACTSGPPARKSYLTKVGLRCGISPLSLLLSTRWSNA